MTQLSNQQHDVKYPGELPARLKPLGEGRAIRRTTLADLETVMQIYEGARRFMAETGNPRQWGQTNWPPEELIRQDIALGRSYVLVEGKATSDPPASPATAAEPCEATAAMELTAAGESAAAAAEGNASPAPAATSSESADGTPGDAGERVLSVFCFTREREEGYERITAEPLENPNGNFPRYAGSWREDGEYGVVHRLASVRRSGGAGKLCILWALGQCGHLKADTHTDNAIMQALFEKLGFERRGYVVPVEDKDPRVAFERIGKPDLRTIYLAGGCFWGVQRFFDQFDGVLETEVGYANGKTLDPVYEELHETGHAETVRIVYDEAVLPLSQLLEDYFLVIDPYSVNKQGPDVGTQYRTGIYYTDERQLPAIEAKIRQVEEQSARKVAVEVSPLANYRTAEAGHQKYLNRMPWGYCHISRNMFELQDRRKKG